MAPRDSKVSLVEKISYVLVNLGNIPITTLMSSYLLIFYTTVCGMDPAACATLFLIARILDALNDPLVGFVIDHMPGTRWGHFRPILIVGTVLCSLNFLLLWFGPMLSMGHKLLIAYISYLLIGVIFPIMDIALNSMLPVMTTDMNERNQLSSIKGLFYMLGMLALSSAAPLILGDSSNRSGYVRLITLVVVLVLVFSVGGTLGLKERVQPEPGQKYSLRDLFRVMTFKPIWSTFLASLFYMIGMTLINTVNAYYFTYVLGNFRLFSVVSLVQTAAIFPAMIVAGRLIPSLGKKKLYIIGLICFGVLPVIRMAAPTNIPLLMVVSLLIGAGQGICMPLSYGIQADNTDYIEVKINQRMEGAVASLSSFITKFSMGIGGAIPGYLLAAAGFDSTASVQPGSVTSVIIMCLTLAPAILSLLGVLVFAVAYPLTKEKLSEQNRFLEEKRAQKAG